MKLLYILIISLFLFSCGDGDSDECYDQGYLCDEYQEIYYRCEDYRYYSDPYGYHDYWEVYVWYQIMDEGQWQVWYGLPAMREHYCN